MAYKKAWRIRTVCVLFCLTMLSAAGASGTFAKYTSGAAADSSASAAAFVFDLSEPDGSAVAVFENIRKPGDSGDYTLSVTNNGRGKIAEVTENYTAEFTVNGSMPVICSVYKNGASDAECEISTIPESGLSVAGSTEGSFPAAVDTTDCYILHAEWPDSSEYADYKDAAYANAASGCSVTITVQAVQQN